MPLRDSMVTALALALTCAACGGGGPHASEGAGVRIVSGPDALTNQTSAELQVECERSGCEIECRLDTATFAPCEAIAGYEALADGAHRFEARAVGAAGEPASHVWTVDTAGPLVTISAGPAHPTLQTAATFEFSCDDNSCAFTCALDDAAFAPCSSPTGYDGIADGAHTFAVRANDSAGNTGATATLAWVVDTVAPIAILASAPPALSPQASADFVFSCNEDDCDFECALDGAAFGPCPSPTAYTGLADGDHSFAVRATDPAGNRGDSADHSWTIDTVLPIVSITSAPPPLTSSPDATFAFSCNESDCTFTCAVDGGAFGACTSPVSYPVLFHGSHTFAVRAIDATGNIGSSATHSWNIDLVAPTVSIISAPAALTNQPNATLAFSCNESNCAFECGLDGAAFTPCASSIVYPDLGDGAHAFAVRATDLVGNIGGAATRAWTVDTVPPATTITSGPPALTSSSSATFGLVASEAASFSCSLDAGPWGSCGSPAAYGTLAGGPHTFAVRATDAAGNQEPSAPTWTWTVTPLLSAIFPSEGTVGVPLILEGARFGATPGVQSVTVGGQVAAVLSWSDTYVVIEVPPGLPAGLHDVTLQPYPNVTRSYRVVPWIRTVDPRVAIPGEPMWAIGTSFGDAAGTGTLRGADASIQDWTSTAVEVQVPAALSGGAAHVQLTTAAGEPTNRFPIDVRGNDVWIPVDAAPSPRHAHAAVWTGTEMIVWGGYSSTGEGLDTGSRYDPVTDTWVALDTPAVLEGRRVPSVLWTGSEMIVWSGYTFPGGPVIYHNSGARYDPSTDTWTNTSTTNAPAGRQQHTALWTGTEMIVWGGGNATTSFATGSRYDPVADSWTSTATTAAPVGRGRHTAVWTGTEMIVWGGRNGASGSLNTGGRYDPTTNAWTSTAIAGAPDPRREHHAVWTGTEMIVWGGVVNNTHANTGGRYNPATDAWSSTNTSGASTPRSGGSCVWTGSRMLLWGGRYATPLDTGSLYDPVADTWTSTSTVDAPEARDSHAAVWTGVEMIVWGGQDDEDFDTGGRYVPATDTWTSTTTGGAPVPRTSGTAVWTGAEMIVWGGARTGARLDSGGRYDPVTDTWTSTNTVGAPAGRSLHSAVWTGTEMIIWGGSNGSYESGMNTGGRYDVITDTWASTAITGAPSLRNQHSAIWTGAEMIVWGGHYGSGPVNTGGRYDPLTDLWVTTPTSGAPSARWNHTAIWTGSRMIVWGGNSGGMSGGRYDPITNSWTSTATSGAPPGRSHHTAVWTGTEMIVWGGNYWPDVPQTDTGGRYDPTSNSWTSTTTTGAPTERYDHTAVWTGTEMIIWGGYFVGPVNEEFATGGRYNPTTNTWTSTTTAGAPAARSNHTAVWTGTEMIVWGGSPLGNGGRLRPP